MSGEAPRWIEDVLAAATEALAATRALTIASRARTDQLLATLATKRAQLDCGYCYGPPGRPPGLYECTCPLPCRVSRCMAGDGTSLADLDQWPE